MTIETPIRETYRQQIRRRLVTVALFYAVTTLVWGAMSLAIFGLGSPFIAVMSTFGWPVNGAVGAFDIGAMLFGASVTALYLHWASE